MSRTNVDVHAEVIVEDNRVKCANHTKDREWRPGAVDIQDEIDDLEEHLGLRENTREKASVKDVGEEGNWDKKRNQK